MRNAFTWGMIAAAWACCFGSTTFAQKEATTEAIESAWKEYSKKLSNVQMKWEIDRTAFKGSVTRNTGEKGKNGEDLPPNDHRHVESYDFSVSGNKIRLDCALTLYNPSENLWMPVKRVTVFDGKNGLAYGDQGRAGPPLHLGTLTKSGSPERLKSEDILPILQWVRPLDADYSTINIGDYQQTGVRAKINGSMCNELRLNRESGTSTVSLWLDPKRSFLITRLTSVPSNRSAGFAGVQEDVEDEEHAASLWVPKKWSRITFGGASTLISKIEGRMISIGIDASFEEKIFETTPPPRTVIVERNGKEQTVSIIRDDGERDIIPDSKISSAVDEINSPSRGWMRRHRLFSAAIAVTIVFTIGAFVSRRRVAKFGRKRAHHSLN